MAKISVDCSTITMSEEDATVLKFLRRQLPYEVRDVWLELTRENGDKDAMLFLLLAFL